MGSRITTPPNSTEQLIYTSAWAFNDSHSLILTFFAFVFLFLFVGFLRCKVWRGLHDHARKDRKVHDYGGLYPEKGHCY